MPERFDARVAQALPRSWDDEDDDTPPIPLTREQAQALRARLPSISVWSVVAAQAAAGFVVAALCWALSGQIDLGWSALYGAASIVLPQVILARGIMKLPGKSPAAAAVGFMFWEGVKLILVLALLLAASRVVPRLSWPALLAALAVCLSVNWVALLWRGRIRTTDEKNSR
jgi:ATP synthase protein I